MHAVLIFIMMIPIIINKAISYTFRDWCQIYIIGTRSSTCFPNGYEVTKYDMDKINAWEEPAKQLSTKRVLNILMYCNWYVNDLISKQIRGMVT